MPNYKPYSGIIIDIQGYVFQFKTGMKLKYLTTLSEGTTESVKDLETGLDYVVPTGKKTRVIYHQSNMNTINQAGEYYGSTTAVDATTGLIKFFEPTTVSLPSAIFVSEYATAGTYITFVMLQNNTCQLICVEEPA